MSPEFDRRAFRDLSYGLYIVTSLDGDRLNGQIVNTVIQVTSGPARVAVILNNQNLTHEFISKSGLFGVSVLDESAPRPSWEPSVSGRAGMWTSSARCSSKLGLPVARWCWNMLCRFWRQR